MTLQLLIYLFRLVYRSSNIDEVFLNVHTFITNTTINFFWSVDTNSHVKESID